MVTDLRDRLTAALARSGQPSTDYDLNRGVLRPTGQMLRPAAVLVAVRPDVQTVILTKRSPTLRHHPGQIAFPGGKQDATDLTLTDAALREAEEEVGLPRTAVDVLGLMPAHETVTGFTVVPVLSLIRGDFTPRAETGEVSEVFEVPLSHFADPARFTVQGRRWQGQMRHYYAVPYGPYYIWGATARILRALADRLTP
ncbi:8-oxo-dGTP pyrophosphatase MutT, NUDIX family [Loktanella fryxellensis]|uniref:8-oxo-dGTP pyrophosphatase MutT, NUDIX family n=1 Tax=Loktanella fryxellensis TaxID=245187 RepID=A0A1H8DUB7_9RHOB|nr:CoA pyrophosphatase [Loktanella fryxellensis]SEN10879.1 8-oxo-dGTP pyrophosphatase MutT, NUDIX family [Loktanella fryxellensis]